MRYILIIILLFLLSLEAKMIRDNTNLVVFDTATKLVWQDSSKTIDINYKRTWEEAVDFCETLDHGGYTDWRLPNIHELNTIADITKYQPAISDIFMYCDQSYYWSSTTYGKSTGLTKAWVIDFTNADTTADYLKTTEAFIRCVRDL